MDKQLTAESDEEGAASQGFAALCLLARCVSSASSNICMKASPAAAYISRAATIIQLGPASCNCQTRYQGRAGRIRADREASGLTMLRKAGSKVMLQLVCMHIRLGVGSLFALACHLAEVGQCEAWVWLGFNESVRQVQELAMLLLESD